jgi:hypothetical protein
MVRQHVPLTPKCIVRGSARAALLALAVAALLPSLGVAQYAPKWHIGDWWVTKTWAKSMNAHPPFRVWRYHRYDVVGIKKVGKRDCFVLETRLTGPKGEPATRTNDVLYVHMDDWLVVRQEIGHTYNDTVCPPWIRNAPLGLFGPFGMGEPRLPRFPLRLGDPDTTFKLKKRDDGFAELREISRIADSSSVKRLLDDGDSADARVVRPTGVVYQIRSEGGGDLGTDNARIVQSLQLWCDDQPWRVYEEVVQYDGPKLVRRVIERSWLIAAGHRKK